MSSLDLLGFGALIVEPPDDQVRARDDDEGGHEADHDANLVGGAGAGVERARGLVGGHYRVEGLLVLEKAIAEKASFVADCCECAGVDGMHVVQGARLPLKMRLATGCDSPFIAGVGVLPADAICCDE